jgi:multidrug efflux pump subunit AcrA (membrane-fusion protein)
MNRARIALGIVIVAALAAGGYWAYGQYLAPAPVTVTPVVTSSEPQTPTLVSAEGVLQPAREAALAFRLAERVAEVLVAEGEQVTAGQALVGLEHADLDAAVAQAEAGVTQAQAAVDQADAAVEQAAAAVAVAEAQLAKVRAGARPEEIAAAEAQLQAAQSAVGQSVAQRNQVTGAPEADQVQAAQAQLAQAQATQKELQIAYDQIIENIKYLAGPTEEKARFQLNAANEAVAAAQAALDRVNAGASSSTVQAYNSAVGVTAYQRDAAEAQLDLLKAGATVEQLAVGQALVQQAQAAQAAAEAGRAVAEAALEVAQAGLTAAQTQLAQATLLAPFAGTVVSVNVEVGELAAPGVPVVVLADLEHWQMRTNDLAETDVVLVRPGQAAVVTLDALAGVELAGTVTEIADVAETNRGNVTYAVTVALDPASAQLRWGMTAFADIHVGP